MNKKHYTRHLEGVYSGLYLGCWTAKRLLNLIRCTNVKMQHHNTKTSVVATRQQIRLVKVEIQPVLPLSTRCHMTITRHTCTKALFVTCPNGGV